MPLATALREELLLDEAPEPIGWATLPVALELPELRAVELLWEVAELLWAEAELLWEEVELLWAEAELLWEDPLLA